MLYMLYILYVKCYIRMYATSTQKVNGSGLQKWVG